MEANCISRVLNIIIVNKLLYCNQGHIRTGHFSPLERLSTSRRSKNASLLIKKEPSGHACCPLLEGLYNVEYDIVNIGISHLVREIV